MPIERTFTVDLEDEKVTAFLSDHQDPDFSSAIEQQTGYVDTGKRKSFSLDAADAEINLYTTIEREYEVFTVDNRMKVSNGITYSVVTHPVIMSVGAALLLKEDCSADIKEKIQNAFEDFVIEDENNNADSVETALVRDGVSISDYQVVLYFSLVRNGSPNIDDSHERAFQIAARSDELYGYRITGPEKEVSGVKDIDLDATGRVAEVDSLQDPKPGLTELALKFGQETDCSDMQPTEHRVGTLFQYPEYKLKWVPKDIKIGRCKIMRTKVPELWTRTRKKALYAIVISPDQARQLLERVFVNCMENSAIVGGLLLLVTGGNFATALSAFKLTMVSCLKVRIPDVVQRCILPELAIITERSSWKKA